MLRRALAFACLAAVMLVLTACGRAAAREAFDARAAAASELSGRRLSEWLGPGRSAVLPRMVPPPFDRRGSMSVESRVAYLHAYERFRHLIADDAHVAGGIAWYLQSRIVEDAFNTVFRRPGYRHLTVCFFDCRVRWPISSLISTRWSDGIGRVHLLRGESGRQWPAFEAPLRLDGRAIRIALLMASLERELGWPSLQGALRAAANARGDERFADVIERATGRDLKTAFAAALASPPADHRLAGVTTAAAVCASTPCHRTRVTVAPADTIPFPMVLVVEFGDGARVVEQWRGEADLEFESAAPATVARLDPGRHWLLDPDYANNARGESQPPASIAKWAARWATWLQDAVLTYTFPI